VNTKTGEERKPKVLLFMKEEKKNKVDHPNELQAIAKETKWMLWRVKSKRN